MPKDIRVIVKVDAQFKVHLWDVPDDATEEQIEDIALERVMWSMEETSDPLHNAEYWDMKMISHKEME